MSNVWKILEAMHGEIAAQIRIILGEPRLDESLFDDAQRQRRIDSMKAVNPNMTDEERHEVWCKAHTDMGWVYSAQFDPQAKTHPMLRRWGRLSQESQCKARIFAIVSKAAQELAELQLCDRPDCQLVQRDDGTVTADGVVVQQPCPEPAPIDPPAPIAPISEMVMTDNAIVITEPAPIEPPAPVALVGDSGSSLLEPVYVPVLPVEPAPVEPPAPITPPEPVVQAPEFVPQNVMFFGDDDHAKAASGE